MIEKLKRFFKMSSSESVSDDPETERKPTVIERKMEKRIMLERALSLAKRIKLDATLGSDSSKPRHEKYYSLVDFELGAGYLKLKMQDNDGIHEGVLEGFDKIEYRVIDDEDSDEAEMKVWFYRKNPLGNYRMYIPYKKSEIS